MTRKTQRLLRRRAAFLFICFGGFFLLLLPTWVSPAKDKKPKADLKIDYALIKGTVFREDGFTLRGAKVSCRRAEDKKPKWETLSGEDGEFAFRLPTGKMEYIIDVEMKGYQSNSKKVEIANDERQDISITLTANKP